MLQVFFNRFKQKIIISWIGGGIALEYVVFDLRAGWKIMRISGENPFSAREKARVGLGQVFWVGGFTRASNW